MIIVTDFAYSQHSLCILNSGGASYCDISNAIATGTITANATKERFAKYKILILFHIPYIVTLRMHV